MGGGCLTVSQLLQPFEGEYGLLAEDGAGEPTGFTSGLPTSSSKLAVASSGAVDHYHMGLPFTADGRVFIDFGAVDYYNTGAMPIGVIGGLAVSRSAVDHYVGGVGYDIDGKVVLGGAEYLVWDGVDAYAWLVCPWEAVGTSDKINILITPSAVDGTEDVILCSATGDFKLYISAAGNISLDYLDTVATVRTITGMAASAGTQYGIEVTFDAGNVYLAVNLSIYTGTDDPDMTAVQVHFIACDETQSNNYPGVIHYLALTTGDDSDSRSFPMDDGPGYYLRDTRHPLTPADDLLKDKVDSDWSTGNGAVRTGNSLYFPGSAANEQGYVVNSAIDGTGKVFSGQIWLQADDAPSVGNQVRVSIQGNGTSFDNPTIVLHDLTAEGAVVDLIGDNKTSPSNWTGGVRIRIANGGTPSESNFTFMDYEIYELCEEALLEGVDDSDWKNIPDNVSTSAQYRDGKVAQFRNGDTVEYR